jgi:rhodanese-related sulfurtransferase
MIVMNNTIYLLLILSILYTYIQKKESFSGYQSRRAICINRFRPNIIKPEVKLRDRDYFGFKIPGLQKNFIPKGVNMLVYCPIRIPANKAHKLINSGQIHYLIDVRSKEEYKLGNIRNSVWIESMASHPDKVQYLDGISKMAYVMVFCSDGERSFRVAEILKRKGGFKRVFYVEYGGYDELKRTVK